MICINGSKLKIGIYFYFEHKKKFIRTLRLHIANKVTVFYYNQTRIDFTLKKILLCSVKIK